MVKTSKKLNQKLADLPLTPGVYFHKNKAGEIIYVGKAAKLKNRVRQYFQNPANRDIKTTVMVKEIADVDWTETESEIDALFLESELIKRYKPKYNIELKDDKSQIFVRIDTKSKYPFISFTRMPFDDRAQYFGPYNSAPVVKKALKLLRKIYPYSTHKILPKRVCLDYHLGLCPGVEEQKISAIDYRKNINNLVMYLKGQRQKLIKQTKQNMQQAARNNQFELAAKYRDQLMALKSLSQQIIFGDREFMDINKDKALLGLKNMLNLKVAPKRIEAYDISHISGTDNSASMVVFINGLPDKANYRKFKMQIPGNNDYTHFKEVISRRFSVKNKSWPMPDLILIDGGKGQVSSVIKVLNEKKLNIPIVGLAKARETLIIQDQNKKTDLKLIQLAINDPVLMLLMRIRDESHRFAISYHNVLSTKRQTKSWLDDLPGFGPKTRIKLIRQFGSLREISLANKKELVDLIGIQKANILIQYLKNIKKLYK